MRTSFRQPVPSWAVKLLLSLTVVCAGAPASREALAAKARKTTPTVVHATPEPRLPGGETRAERERRLKRECKGRPNAGACSGHAR